MSKFKEGDWVQRKKPDPVGGLNAYYRGEPFQVARNNSDGYVTDPDGSEHAQENLATYFPEQPTAQEAAATVVKAFASLATAVDPDHYRFGNAQVIDITRHLPFPEGNVIKYVARAGRKGDRLEDLKKAQKYLTWAIENAEAENG